MIDSTEPAASSHPQRPRRRLTIAALATAGLASGAALTATAANASGPGSGSGSGSSSATSTQQSAPSTAPKPPGGKGDRPPAPKPHLDGTVTSVSGQTITITDPEGFTRVIQFSSSTTFTRDGKTVTESAVVGGRFVHAEGSVDSNRTSLDATSVVVLASAPKPGAGPAGIPRPGGRPMPVRPGKAPTKLKPPAAPPAPGNASAPTARTTPSAPTAPTTSAHGS